MTNVDYPIKELRREVKKYYGIEYAMTLIAQDSVNNQEETPMGEKNYTQWWVLEHTEQSKKMATGIGPDFLWFDTYGLGEARMQDKYHECELKAVMQINGLMEKFPKRRGKRIAKEIKDYLYVVAKTTPQRIIFKIKKLIGRQI